MRLAVQPLPTKGLLVVRAEQVIMVIMAAVVVVLLKLGPPVRIWLTVQRQRLLESDVTAATVKRQQYQALPCRMLAAVAAVPLITGTAPQGWG